MSDAMIEPDLGRRTPDRMRRWAELALLFVGVPLAMAFAMDPRWFQPVLLGLGVVGVGLLFFTREFRWRSLIEGKVLAHWPLLLIFTIGAIVLISGTLWLEAPNDFFFLVRELPGIWIMVMIGYPLVLVTIQELVFRSLFFTRYGDLFPSVAVSIFVNSVLFGLAHLFYWNWPAVVLTFIANFFFAYAYVYKQSFPLVWVLHTISGTLVFTIGLGRFFFHGAVPN